jgi:6,7-dimethyl-8-ribityllumazine synthase
VKRSPEVQKPADTSSAGAHILIIEARFYEGIADELLRGAITALDRAGATHERISVLGALEIPAALSMALEAMAERRVRYDGFVLLGCVIRGETSHYDIVSGQSARAAMDLAVDAAIAVGNGILTVENEEQAWARARVSEMDKGGGAAEAALTMIAIRRRFGLMP